VTPPPPKSRVADGELGDDVISFAYEMKRGRAERSFVERDCFTSFLDPELGLDARHEASTIAFREVRNAFSGSAVR
jgi:hypothetical protein